MRMLLLRLLRSTLLTAALLACAAEGDDVGLEPLGCVRTTDVCVAAF